MAGQQRHRGIAEMAGLIGRDGGEQRQGIGPDRDAPEAAILQRRQTQACGAQVMGSERARGAKTSPAMRRLRGIGGGVKHDFQIVVAPARDMGKVGAILTKRVAGFQHGHAVQLHGADRVLPVVRRIDIRAVPMHLAPDDPVAVSDPAQIMFVAAEIRVGDQPRRVQRADPVAGKPDQTGVVAARTRQLPLPGRIGHGHADIHSRTSEDLSNRLTLDGSIPISSGSPTRTRACPSMRMRNLICRKTGPDQRVRSHRLDQVRNHLEPDRRGGHQRPGGDMLGPHADDRGPVGQLRAHFGPEDRFPRTAICGYSAQD